ncbi:MAG TPA: general stress protein [Polyangiaceae bacterium]|nr:general stress protein [Polyangiaceae bacterium]
MVRFAHDKFDHALCSGEFSRSAPVVPTLTPTPQAKVASYPTLEQARKAVEVLFEEGLPRRHVYVVDDARRPAAAFTYGRAAVQGAAAGAWVGLALGFLSGVVKLGTWHMYALGEPSLGGRAPFLVAALFCALAGSLVGALLGAFTHAITDASEGEAGEGGTGGQYDVLVDAEHAEGARTLLWLEGP